ncbi:MAG TPA: family 20 glycosylhydrolase [Pseudonocardiaceae bacterium]|nr:family 20 glycosylhydrolase [Pseudonocardiaceae bacterium]
MVPRPRTWLPFVAAALAVAGLAVPVSAATVNPAPEVLPSLQQWTGGTGDLVLGARSRIVVDTPQLRSDAQSFAADLRTSTDLPLPVVFGGQPAAGDIVLTLAPSHANGYQLTITSSSARIAGNDPTGAFYGEQTVEQLLATRHNRLPVGTATDWPGTGYRGTMLDLGRHYYSVDYVLDQIRQAAWDKLSTVHLHFTEQNAFRLRSTTYPGLAAPQSYSHTDIARMVAYAKRYHVEIVPEIDIPAHSVPIGQYDPSLEWDCASMNGSAYQSWPGYTLDITKPATTTFITNLLKEFVPLFPDSPVFHLGGDEYPELAAQQQCPELVSYARQHGFASTEDVFVSRLNQLAQVVSSLGKRPEIWNWWDVAGGATIQPDKDIIIDAWTGTADAYLNAGYDTVSSPGNLLYVTPGAAPGSTGPGTDDTTLYSHWTPVTNPHLLGYEVSRWSDNAVTEPDAYFDWFAQRMQQVVADRLWGAPRGYSSVFAFEDAADQIGAPPGVPANVDSNDVLLTGTPYGTSPAWGGSPNTFDKAFDGDPATFFDYAQASGGYTGIDLGADHAATVTAIRFVPRAGQSARMVGGVFQGCTGGPTAGCHNLATVNWTPGADWHDLAVTDPAPYRWLRYVGPDNGYCNVAEIQFYTAPTGLTGLSTGIWQPGGTYRVSAKYAGPAVPFTLAAYSTDSYTRLPVRPLGGPNWLVQVPTSAPAGNYRLVAQAGTAQDSSTVLVPLTSLAAAANNVGVTDDNLIDPADLLNGFDGDTSSFSAQALAAAGVTSGGPVTAGGLTFAWPTAKSGTPDNVIAAGQTVDFHGSGHTLGFLLSGAYGPVGGTGTLTYTDGSTAPFSVSAPDWQVIPAGANVAVSTSYHNLAGTGKVNRTTDLFYDTVPLDPGKELAMITLPATTGPSAKSALHVFAVATG